MTPKKKAKQTIGQEVEEGVDDLIERFGRAERRRQNLAKNRKDRWSKETPEEKAERLRNEAARRRELREYYKKIGRKNETPEEKKRRIHREETKDLSKAEREEIRRRKRREWMREKRRNEAPEEKAERLRKEAERQRRRWAEDKKILETLPETQEGLKRKEEVKEKRRRKEKGKLEKRRWMTEEKREEWRRKRRLVKKRWRDLEETEKEKRREQWRNWVKNLEGERKQRWKEKTHRRIQRYYEKMRRERPEKLEEIREKQKKKCREIYGKETPEQRRKRRWKDQVYGACRRLKERLEGLGVMEEEIESRLEEMKEQMWREFDPEWEVPSTKTRGNWKRNNVDHKEVSDYKFICFCCKSGTKQSLFKTRLELVGHVKLRHSKNYWPCSSCDLLKYSEKSLQVHVKICGGR